MTANHVPVLSLKVNIYVKNLKCILMNSNFDSPKLEVAYHLDTEDLVWISINLVGYFLDAP